MVEVHETETFFGGSTNNHLIKPNSANWELGHPKKAALRNSSKANTHLFFQTPTLSSAKETKIRQPLRAARDIAPNVKDITFLGPRTGQRGIFFLSTISSFENKVQHFSVLWHILLALARSGFGGPGGNKEQRMQDEVRTGAMIGTWCVF